jgi:hypothetical protein
LYVLVVLLLLLFGRTGGMNTCLFPLAAGIWAKTNCLVACQPARCLLSASCKNCTWSYQRPVLSGPLSMTALRVSCSRHLDANQLSGPLPTDIGQMFSLKFLYVFVSVLAFPRFLTLHLRVPHISNVSNNALSGSIPASVNNLQITQYFYAAYNQFTGALPSGIGSMNSLQAMYAAAHETNADDSRLI